MKRHLIIPDTQIRPGVRTEHIDWAARAIVEYMPDVIVVLGDWGDYPSCGTHATGKEREGLRIKEDIGVANEAFARLIAPMTAEMQRRIRRRRKHWTPERHFLFGNHEDRLDRYVNAHPEVEGIVSTDLLVTPGFKRHSFNRIVEIDGIWYSHFFANQHSGKPIGGTIDNRLNKIGQSFVQGHEQGFLYGLRQFPDRLVRHGLVCGSFYLHDEPYRGNQCNGEWRGIVVLNEVENGGFDIMPLSMNYLRRRFG